MNLLLQRIEENQIGWKVALSLPYSFVSETGIWSDHPFVLWASVMWLFGLEQKMLCEPLLHSLLQCEVAFFNVLLDFFLSHQLYGCDRYNLIRSRLQ